MKKSIINDRVDILKELTKLSIPILFGMIAESLYLLSDTYFISIIDKNDPSIISGVGLVFPIPFLLTSIDQGIGTGISTITAIATGENNKETIKKTAITGYNLSLYFGILMVATFFIFGEQIINILSGQGISSFTKTVAIQYLKYSLPGFIFMFCVQARFSVFQGIGNTKTVGKAMVASTVLNTILNPIFIFSFDLGVRGAAMATVVSQVCLWIYVTYIYYKSDITKFKISNLITFDFELLKRILKLGMPASISFVILSTWFIVINKFVSSINEVSMNAYTLIGRLNGILTIPALAFSIGLSIMIGQSYGEKNMKKVKKSYLYGTSVITVLTGLLSIIFMIISRFVLSAMSDNVEVISTALRQVYLTTIPASIGTAVAICASNSLQAIERPIKAMLTTGIRTIFISVPLILLVEALFGQNILFIWISTTVGIVCGAIIGFMWFLMEFEKINIQNNKIV